MIKPIYSFLTILLILSFLTSGCYYFGAKREMGNAERLISQLKAAGGEKQVPYEYCSAEKFLEVSRMEFNENSYNGAYTFAVRSKAAAEAGLSKVKK